MSEREAPSAGFGDLPGVARLAAGAAWHTTEFSVEVGVRLARRMLEVAAAPQKAGELVEDIRDAAQAATRELLGEGALEQQGAPGADGDERSRSESMPGAEVARRVAEAVPGGDVARKMVETIATPALRAYPGRVVQETRYRDGEVPLSRRGQELLYRSRDVHYEEDSHPAYDRLVESLAPDEARILQLLLFQGPQPSIDVRTGGPLGLINSRLLAPGLSMIGARAGCRYAERVPSYLTNLNRLGLIWFSRETLREPERYQVVEAQPDVLEALHSVRYAKIVRRSIHLTPFGEGFCRAALVEDKRQLASLPEHGSPQGGREPQPPELTD